MGVDRARQRQGMRGEDARPQRSQVCLCFEYVVPGGEGGDTQSYRVWFLDGSRAIVCGCVFFVCASNLFCFQFGFTKTRFLCGLQDMTKVLCLFYFV